MKTEEEQQQQPELEIKEEEAERSTSDVGVKVRCFPAFFWRCIFVENALRQCDVLVCVTSCY